MPMSVQARGKDDRGAVRTAAKGRPAGRHVLGFVGLALVALFVITAVFSGYLSPYEPFQIAPQDRLQAPSAAHWLGTDQLGRDLLSRVIAGSRIALAISVSSIVISVVLGVLLGLASGYGPRWLDNALILCFDTLRSFPTIIFALATIAMLGSSYLIVMLVIVVTMAPNYARLVRTATLALRNAEFILAERSLGARPPRILLRHVLPNIIGPVLIIASMDIPTAIAVEAGLSFLGMGLPPPAPSWGRILNEGYTFIRDTPWLVIAGGFPLILVTLGFTFLGEYLRDRLDPKLRGAGRHGA